MADLPPSGGHTAAALAVLGELDRELAENAEQLGQSLKWSATETLIRELIADEIDRREHLRARWQAADDDKVRLKVASELRLTEQSVERLLRRINTEAPVVSSPRASRQSERASHAVHRRWQRRGY